MTSPGTPEGPSNGPSGADLRAVTFSWSHAFGRGYDPQQVDSFVERCASVVDDLRRELSGLRHETAQLQERIDRDSRSQEVAYAVGILTSAQKTADKTVEEADAYSAKVMSEARELYEDTRRNAATLEQETEEKARHVYDEAIARAASIERETGAKLEQMTMSAVTAQKELDQQTAYLRTLRDATRTQMEVFLEGMLDRIADEYGRAHPLAVEAANQKAPRRPRRPGRAGGRGTQNGRASARVAGMDAERRRALSAPRDSVDHDYAGSDLEETVDADALEWGQPLTNGR